MTKRLAFQVADVAVTEHSIKPTAEIRKQLNALKGKPVDANAIVDLLTSVLRAPPAGTAGIEIQIEREGDGRGADILMTLVPDKSKGSAKSASYEAWEDVFVDGKEVHSHGYSSSSTVGRDAGHWADFAKHLKQALDTPPGVRVYVNAGSTKSDFGSGEGYKH